MNMKKLFDQQRILRDRIGYNESDRFEKLVLALLVELGECANEWRGFKFWSKNQEPNYKLYDDDELPLMEDCGLKQEYPLLEEYVDGLHFVLEIGIELEIVIDRLEFDDDKAKSIAQQFIDIHYLTTHLHENQRFYAYEMLLAAYLELGKMLGFTWEEVEIAYYTKNEINHQRQENGY